MRIMHEELTHEHLERSYVRLMVKAGGGLLLFILLCWGGCQLNSHYQERRGVRRAVGYLSGGDLKAAALSARRALQINPQNRDAMRVMAQIGERAGDKTALEWRRKALETGATTDDLIALARAALQFREVKVAGDALARVDAKGKETGAYLFAMSQLAAAQGNKAEAEDFATRASERGASEPSYTLQLGLLRLQLPEKRDSGRSLLSALRADPKTRTPATRALIADAVEHHETGMSIRDLAEELKSYPEAIFSDRLLYLDILRQLNDAGFASYLTEVEDAAATNSVDLGSLISWMNRSNLSTLAIDYVRRLPAESLAKWPVPLALAESYSNVASWEQLKDLAREGAWGGFEFLRHAFLARAYRGEDNAAQFSREWEAALKDAAKDAQHLTLLARTVGEWRWRAETEDILWQMAKLPETQNDALRTLYREYARRGDTTNLYRVLTRLNAADPQDLLVRN